MIDLLRRAWDALDTFKQTYPENWHEDDQQVLDDLLKADLDLSGVKRKWQGLTTEDMATCIDEPAWDLILRKAEQILKDKNT